MTRSVHPSGVASGEGARHGRPVVLTLRALGIGDLLTGVPALRAIAEHDRQAKTVLAAPSRLRPLVDLIGGVDALVDARPFEPGTLARLRPRVAINLHGRGPASHRMLLATHPTRLIAFHHPDVPASAGSPLWDPEEHEVVRWCRMLSEHGISADPSRLGLRPPGPPPAGLAGATVIHPGAASSARRWPPARWAAVARAEAATGAHVVVTGSADERPIAASVASGAGLPPSANLAGKLGLGTLASLVAGAALVMSGDTGVAHLATAFGTPSVVLFGPTPPHRWGPPAGRPQHVCLWAGGTGDPHARATDPGLLRIGIGDVLEAAARARRVTDGVAEIASTIPLAADRARRVHA